MLHIEHVSDTDMQFRDGNGYIRYQRLPHTRVGTHNTGNSRVFADIHGLLDFFLIT